jgi:hypothetical protein
MLLAVLSHSCQLFRKPVLSHGCEVEKIEEFLLSFKPALSRKPALSHICQLFRKPSLSHGCQLFRKPVLSHGYEVAKIEELCDFLNAWLSFFFQKNWFHTKNKRNFYLTCSRVIIWDFIFLAYLNIICVIETLLNYIHF